MFIMDRVPDKFFQIPDSDLEEKNLDLDLQHWVYILIFQAVVQYGILYTV